MSASDRTAQKWLKELIESPRFKMAMSNFELDPQFMMAILTEIVLETKEVTRDKMMGIYAKNFKATKEIVLDLMRNYTEFTGFKSAWKMTPTELRLYSLDPKNEATPAQRKKLLKILQNSFMNERNLPKDFFTKKESLEN